MTDAGAGAGDGTAVTIAGAVDATCAGIAAGGVGTDADAAGVAPDANVGALIGAATGAGVAAGAALTAGAAVVA
jgi:hypothetical protein